VGGEEAEVDRADEAEEVDAEGKGSGQTAKTKRMTTTTTMGPSLRKRTHH